MKKFDKMKSRNRLGEIEISYFISDNENTYTVRTPLEGHSLEDMKKGITFAQYRIPKSEVIL